MRSCKPRASQGIRCGPGLPPSAAANDALAHASLEDVHAVWCEVGKTARYRAAQQNPVGLQINGSYAPSRCFSSYRFYRISSIHRIDNSTNPEP